ncbi:hypothetical protein GW17_00055714 [Ensete ventricosum]|uniref:Uncharacterized protein n=1 Tax=Ensete ventricosum TaxID=4639 RepID=A0A444CA60_ENSVE|nr:hypothetical protein GW17_00055714 [Ensete ventricosum]RZR70530.1 hypothetical protein BHM03_00000382 [Ensete ventricosum]
MSEARMSWAKNSILTTVVDDFFDFGGSREELESLISLVEEYREGKEGKLNSVSLRILQSRDGLASEEEVKKEMQRAIDGSRTELLRLVLQQDGSVVPRPCKDLFWKMCRILHVFYMKTDGFTSPKEMLVAVNSVIHEPPKVSHI